MYAELENSFHHASMLGGISILRRVRNNNAIPSYGTQSIHRIVYSMPPPVIVNFAASQWSKTRHAPPGLFTDVVRLATCIERCRISSPPVLRISMHHARRFPRHGTSSFVCGGDAVYFLRDQTFNAFANVLFAR